MYCVKTPGAKEGQMKLKPLERFSACCQALLSKSGLTMGSTLLYRLNICLVFVIKNIVWPVILWPYPEEVVWT